MISGTKRSEVNLWQLFEDTKTKPEKGGHFLVSCGRKTTNSLNVNKKNLIRKFQIFSEALHCCTYIFHVFGFIQTVQYNECVASKGLSFAEDLILSYNELTFSSYLFQLPRLIWRHLALSSCKVIVV